MTAILGLSAYYHDSAAALVVDGRVVAAAQEERFTRVRNDASFPRHAVDNCLREAGLEIADLDLVGFYEKPLLKFDRLLETYLAFAPAGFRSFARAMPAWLGEKLWLKRIIRNELGRQYRRRLVFPRHHQSHAASAYFPSPFDNAAILTIDGVGEWATATIGRGVHNRIELLRMLCFPHSLGMLYSAFTSYCGFRVNSGEYKLMGLAPYGQPRYADLIRKTLIDLRDDGSFRLNLEYFNYCQGLTMTSRRFHQLFGRPPRQPDTTPEELDLDLAASVQQVTEEIVLRMARHAQALTGCENLCLAGGVALNCVANGRLLRDGPFRNLWIQPSAGDAGGALGAALLICHQLLGHPRHPDPHDAQQGSLLGPCYSAPEIRQTLDSANAIYTEINDEHRLLETVARELAQGRVVGWMQGRMEFGPRALGNRSILADPRQPGMQSLLNRKIKFRESFRPFAPAVLKQHAPDWFDVPEGYDSPYMLLVAPVRNTDRIKSAGSGSTLPPLDRLQQVHSPIPAVTHVDASARIQTVDPQRFPRFAALLDEFFRQTGCPVLVNTSFNVRGEPIVCSPLDAWRCFLRTDMDLLVIENFLLHKRDQPAELIEKSRENPAAFPPD